MTHPAYPHTLSRRQIVGAALSTLLATPRLARGATDFPNRPLRLIVPAPTGGVQDVQSRRLVPRLNELWAQPVVVDNRPGAAGSIALEQLARAAPDGYTMAMAPVAIAVIPHLMKVPYDPLADLVAVTRVTSGPYILVAPAAAPYSTLPQLLDHARREGKPIGIGGFGTGSLANLVVLLLSRVTGVAFQHIPYAGGGQQLTDLIGGQVPLMLDFAAVVKPHLGAGRLKALGLTGSQRLAVMPEVPTFEEQGVTGMQITAWQGIVVPAGTPDAVVRALNAGLVKAINDPEVRASYIAEGAEIGGDAPEAFGAFIRAEHARWGQVIREAGLKLG
jgi:tripartite-type tricarboxylate transporter receptor subunit TctC